MSPQNFNLSTRVMPLLGYCSTGSAAFSEDTRSELGVLEAILTSPANVQAAWRAHNFFTIFWNDGLVPLIGELTRCLESGFRTIEALKWHRGFEKHAAYSLAFREFCANQTSLEKKPHRSVAAKVKEIYKDDSSLAGKANRLLLGAIVLAKLPPAIQSELSQFSSERMADEYGKERLMHHQGLRDLQIVLKHIENSLVLEHAEALRGYLSAARNLWRNFEVQESMLAAAYNKLGAGRRLQPRDMKLAFECTLLPGKPRDIFSDKQRSGLGLGPLMAIVSKTPKILNSGLTAPSAAELRTQLSAANNKKARGQPLNDPFNISLDLAVRMASPIPFVDWSPDSDLMIVAKAAKEIAVAAFTREQGIKTKELRKLNFDVPQAMQDLLNLNCSKIITAADGNNREPSGSGKALHQLLAALAKLV